MPLTILAYLVGLLFWLRKSKPSLGKPSSAIADDEKNKSCSPVAK